MNKHDAWNAAALAALHQMEPLDAAALTGAALRRGPLLAPPVRGAAGAAAAGTEVGGAAQGREGAERDPAGAGEAAPLGLQEPASGSGGGGGGGGWDVEVLEAGLEGCGAAAPGTVAKVRAGSE
jgi:hypothetical protein